MKKLRIAVLMIILAFSFSVQAKVSLKINCDSNIIYENKITCKGNLLYEQEGINDIEFTYQTNLNIDFIDVKGFTITKTDNKVLIHSNRTLFDMIMNSTKIMEFTLSTNDKVSDIENLIINNIKVNNDDSILINDISNSFNINKTINELDSVCTLDSILVDNEIINDFNKDKLEYYLNVKNEMIFIDAIRTSDKSSAVGLGNVRVSIGSTIERDIIVTAENEEKKIYKLFITNTNIQEKKEEQEDKIKSNDNTFKKLELYSNNKKIDFNFDNKKEIFNIDVIDINLITIKMELNDSKATFVKGYEPRNIKLNYGYNKVLIKILAENNDEKVITLNIMCKDSLVDNNELESLTINNINIDLNNENIEIILPNDIDKTSIVAIPKNNKAIVKCEDTNLIVGDNKIIVEVISVSGISRIYNINVIREDKEILLSDIPVKETTVIINKDNNLINIICYSIFIIGITAFIISIIYFNKKKKTL